MSESTVYQANKVTTNSLSKTANRKSKTALNAAAALTLCFMSSGLPRLSPRMARSSSSSLQAFSRTLHYHITTLRNSRLPHEFRQEWKAKTETTKKETEETNKTAGQ
jgi:hypothetical protein